MSRDPRLYLEDIVEACDRSQADALYLRLDESKTAAPEEVQAGVVLDFNDEGKVVGVEILRISSRLDPASLKSLRFDTA